MKRRGKRGGRVHPRAERHPEFKRTGNQRTDALQRLQLDHAKRKIREARALCVYDWKAEAGGDCEECGTPALKLFTGRPPIHLTTLPRAEKICSSCASQFEALARQRKEEDACKSET